MAGANPEKIDPSPEPARLREAIEALEAVVRDRGLLRTLSIEERTRLLSAAGEVYNPDLETRRRGTKALRRREKEDRRARDEQVLADTGLRVLRDKPVFTTPNFEAPAERTQEEADGAEPERREVIEPQHCYVCKRHYVEVHPFYDQLCAECGDFNFAKRGEIADLTGRVALLTGGSREDRLPGRDQAAPRRRAPDRHDSLPARLRRPILARARLRGVGRPARGVRARPAPHPERRRTLRPPGRHEGEARLHRQQRLPDGAATGRLLPPHDRERDRRRADDARTRAAARRRVRAAARQRPSGERGACNSRARLRCPA